MTAEELAFRHPRLFHVNIKRHGLLSTSFLLDLFGIKGEQRATLEEKPRPISVPLENTKYGRVFLNDNVPLSEKALQKCLDDNLKPHEWLRLLNARVFFWPTEKSLKSILNARLNRTRAREIIIINTLSLAEVHSKRIELCPINSGSTLRKPARRGINIFTPLLRFSYKEWSKLRGGHDHIHEITIKDHVLDIADHIIDVVRS